MHKTNCMQSIEIFQHGKYFVAYVYNAKFNMSLNYTRNRQARILFRVFLEHSSYHMRFYKENKNLVIKTK